MAFSKKSIFYLFAVLVFVFGAYFFFSGDRSIENAERVAGLRVAATINPLYDILKNIAGDGARVVRILPPGASPHTYDPSPGDIVRLQETKIIFAIGFGLDDRATGIGAAVPGSKIATVERGIELIEREEDEEARFEEEEGEDEHGHEGLIDPHYWLSFVNAENIAENIRDTLIEADPEGAAGYEQNTADYIAGLRQARSRLKGGLTGLTERKIITLHDGWYYFARDFGLEIVGTLEPSAGREPTPRYLAELGRAARESGVSVIFAEPQLHSQALETFAKENNLSIAVLDPLGGTPGREGFIELMEYNAAEVLRALGGADY